MASKIKMYLCRKVADSLKDPKITPHALKSLIQLNSTNKLPIGLVEMTLSANDMESQLGVKNTSDILQLSPDDIIASVAYKSSKNARNVCFQINKDIFLQEVLNGVNRPDISMDTRKKIVVEYSSPNIAKPFHVGHLRSTIIGNFIANLNTYLANSVTKINYLGDWGTQFGFVKLGLDSLDYSLDDLRANPLSLLYKSYVHANTLLQHDPTVRDQAKIEFARLESGCADGLAIWSQILEYTVVELKEMYERLGVCFDQYEYESMYRGKVIGELLDKLREGGVLRRMVDGKEVAEVGALGTGMGDKRSVTLVKSDGTALYLTRDVAAAIDRHRRLQFDRMYYVVDNGQTDHFVALRSLLTQMGHRWSDRLVHVKFGRVKGMSTRRGKVVFLREILDETHELMLQKQIESPTTKAPISDSKVTDTLGVSCVLINDLKQRRQKDYEFSWSNALEAKGDTGIKLQYTHCRLCSLERNSGVPAANESIPALLSEPEVFLLVREIARFEDVLQRAHEQLEACLLVNYLFHLCNHINKALKVLNVKNEDGAIAAQRMLLFNRARETLNQGMCILGLKPLNEM